VIGTLGVLYYSAQNGSREYALTLTFTTFVLFQVFNVFNSRNETDSSLNRSLFANRMLWLAIMGVVTLQVVAVTWKPAQTLFHTTTLSPADWGLAVAVSASVLLMEEFRKWIVRLQSVRTKSLATMIENV
jgi:Ca2+-transporting ATPase